MAVAPRPRGATRSATRSTGARCASAEEEQKQRKTCDSSRYPGLVLRHLEREHTGIRGPAAVAAASSAAAALGQ